MTVRLYEWEKTVTGGDWIEVTDNKVINLILRNLNNLIKINDNNEVYVELQLEDGLDSSDSLPIWVNVGRVMQADWRPVTGTLISGQTTSWDWVKILYWDDGEIRVDNGTWEWDILQYKLTAGEWIEIADKTYLDNQWPCPYGFHIPTKDEVTWLKTIMTWLGFTAYDNFAERLHMPLAWYLNDNWEPVNRGSGHYRTCTRSSFISDANCIVISNSAYPDQIIDVTHPQIINRWFSIRPFKDSYEEPDSTWTVIAWTLWESWIFWNVADWLISVTNWTLSYTMSDKNLWATTVYNAWDSLSKENCGWFFQWWNNNMFPFSWATTTDTTTVNTTWYWPWNYYSSDVFITHQNGSAVVWDNSQNKNLWWWQTLSSRTIKNVITNTWVLSVNWMTGHVNINSWAIVSDVEPADAPAGTMWLDWSAWQLKISNGEWGRYGIDIDSRPR